LTIAGLLHDVGKLQISDTILNKPAALTDAEYDVIKRHPLLGHETLVALGLPDEAKWVLHHHERSDGRGYPSGLVGEEIPIGSRILLAADAWECMTADRPYRLGMSMELASHEMLECTGSQFDPDVAGALLELTLAPGWLLPRLTVTPDRLMGVAGIAPHSPHHPHD
jgi:polar amino acid transport system substrate-binding protein